MLSRSLSSVGRFVCGRATVSVAVADVLFRLSLLPQYCLFIVRSFGPSLEAESTTEPSCLGGDFSEKSRIVGTLVQCFTPSRTLGRDY